MRIAVHFPKDHPVSPGAVVAYRLGRIVDGVHNHVMHEGVTVPLDEFVGGLVAQARAEFPDCDVRIERLIEHGEGEGRWIDSEKFNPSRHTPLGAGKVLPAREVSVASRQRGAR